MLNLASRGKWRYLVSVLVSGMQDATVWGAGVTGECLLRNPFPTHIEDHVKDSHVKVSIQTIQIVCTSVGSELPKTFIKPGNLSYLYTTSPSLW